VKRLILVLLVAAAVVAGVVVYFVRYSLDGVVARAIERQGSAITGTAVRVRGVHIDLASRSGTVRGITVANPEGYSREPAIALREIVIDLEDRSPTGNPIGVETIRLGTPEVRLELHADGGSNLDRLRHNVERARRGDARAEGGGGSSGGGREAEGSGEPRRLRVAQVVIEPGSLHIDASDLGRDPLDVELAEVDLHALGGRDGAPPGEVGAVVARALIDRTLRAAAGAEAKRALGELGKKLDDKIDDWLQKGLGQ